MNIWLPKFKPQIDPSSTLSLSIAGEILNEANSNDLPDGMALPSGILGPIPEPASQSHNKPGGSASLLIQDWCIFGSEAVSFQCFPNHHLHSPSHPLTRFFTGVKQLIRSHIWTQECTKTNMCSYTLTFNIASGPGPTSPTSQHPNILFVCICNFTFIHSLVSSSIWAHHLDKHSLWDEEKLFVTFRQLLSLCRKDYQSSSAWRFVLSDQELFESIATEVDTLVYILREWVRRKGES